MPKKDPDLEFLRKRLVPGTLYRFENESSLNIWFLREPKKFPKKLRSGHIVLYIKLERSPSENRGFRFYLVRGEDIGYVLLKRYEVISCIKSVDQELFLK
jgi:hypothetical protein